MSLISQNSILFDTKEEAETILCQIKEVFNKHKCVLMTDIYVLLGRNLEYYKSFGVYAWFNVDSFKLKKRDDNRWWIEYSKPVLIRESQEKQETDMVNHPQHYISETGLETIEVLEAFTFDLKGIEAVATGNILKYMCRWKSKNGLQDLEKAQWYLSYLIEHVRKLEEDN